MKEQGQTEGYFGIQWGTQSFRTVGPTAYHVKYGKVGMEATGDRANNNAGLKHEIDGVGC